ncbi:hypothetical protein RRG08_036561 [Elysia crispata]|uniref:Uncharacterized protein n=1 Tax=Elysia crispata TaxID=231223 RepID=A0AAE0XXN2_9GAST|nr:hypothetical protein RRG08_036561 [Elysia crispata]
MIEARIVVVPCPESRLEALFRRIKEKKPHLPYRNQWFSSFSKSLASQNRWDFPMTARARHQLSSAHRAALALRRGSLCRTCCGDGSGYIGSTGNTAEQRRRAKQAAATLIGDWLNRLSKPRGSNPVCDESAQILIASSGGPQFIDRPSPAVRGNDAFEIIYRPNSVCYLSVPVVPATGCDYSVSLPVSGSIALEPLKPARLLQARAWTTRCPNWALSRAPGFNAPLQIVQGGEVLELINCPNRRLE